VNRSLNNQWPSARSNFYNRNNVNNVSGNNSQMASSASTRSIEPSRGQGSGRGPPTQSLCSLHGMKKGHWSYEFRTLLWKKQIEEDKKRTTHN
jgi:hypothetical protein